jgi:hypothetical protein
VKDYAVHKYLEGRKIAKSPVEISKTQKFPDGESTESHEGEFPDANLIMDSSYLTIWSESFAACCR